MEILFHGMINAQMLEIIVRGENLIKAKGFWNYD